MTEILYYWHFSFIAFLKAHWSALECEALYDALILWISFIHFILNQRTFVKRNQTQAFEQPNTHLQPILLSQRLLWPGVIYSIGGGTL